MTSKLHLRRVMYNPGRGNTTELSPEDYKKTLVSLEADRVCFGRSEISDYVFRAGPPGSDIEPHYISKTHAMIQKIFENGVERYTVQDLSENGTYLNDRRLTEVKEPIKEGDTIKFGYKNGAHVLTGTVVSQPDAEFAFVVESPKDEDTCRHLEAIRDLKFDLYSQSAMCAERKAHRSTVNVVQQSEADSTNGGTEADVAGISVGHGSTDSDAHQQIPSTSQSSHPKKSLAPHNKFASIDSNRVISFLYGHGSQMFKIIFDEQVERLKIEFPSIGHRLAQTLVTVNVLNDDPTLGKIDLIRIVIEALKNTERVCEVGRLEKQLADFLVFEEPNKIDMVDLLGSLVNPPKPTASSSSVQSSVNDPSAPASNDANGPNSSNKIVAPIAIRPIVPCPYPNYLNPNAPYLQFMQNMPFLPGISSNSFQKWEAPKQGYINDGFVGVAFQQVAPSSRIAREVGVITSTEAALGSNGPEDAVQDLVRNESSSDLDEERHSASSGSTANSRRRTESEDSEILDVVGTDEQNQPIEKPNSVIASKPTEKRDAIREVSLEDSLHNGGTQTPSPVLPDSEVAVAQNEKTTRRNIEEASDALRNSATPCAGSSSTAASTLPTPMNSPFPRPPPPISATPSLSETTGAEALVKETAEKKTGENAEKERQEGENKLQTDEEEVNERLESKETSRRNDEESRKEKEEGDKATKSAAGKKSAEDEEQVQKRKYVRRAPKVDQQKKETPARRKMKQLGESSVDSESDDDEKTPQKKKVLRSARTAPHAKTGAEEIVEGEEEGTPKRRRPYNNLKRTSAESGVRKAKASADTPENEDGDEPPKKRRGRKKAALVTVDEPTEPAEEQDAEAEGTGEKDPKEECGVGVVNCISHLYQGRRPLNWVECEKCEQWYHTYCIKVSNVKYTKKDEFVCCGETANKDAIEAINGRTAEREKAKRSND
ncbi:unnamed protein product [Caenorhabditis sp. 36 PRJEB53466]|nr:unnamed protein product [Caenorhabditis sp. 36 PRJEB53466]